MKIFVDENIPKPSFWAQKNGSETKNQPCFGNLFILEVIVGVV
jgi:hypothetical protein